MKLRLLLLMILSVFTLTSCDEGETDTVVTISTKYGDMTAVLFDKAPKHKANFIKLAKEGYFNGTVFHRVMKDFMIQGGDPDSKTAKPGQPLGNGGPGYTIPAEITPELYHEKGALAAARLGDEQNPSRASSGSQFYIVQGRKVSEIEAEDLKIDQQKLNEGLTQFVRLPENKGVLDTLRLLREQNAQEAFQEKIFSLIPRIEKKFGIVIKSDNPEKIKAYTTIGGYPPLDGGYTVFGKVVKGLDVIDKIALVQTDEANRPVEDIAMTVTVKEMAKSKITKLYGVQYPTSAAPAAKP